MRFAFDASFDELVLSDPRTGVILDVNRRFEENVGVLREQVIGTAVDALNVGLGEAERQRVRAQLQRDGSVRFGCLRIRHDGTKYAADAVARYVARGLDTLCLTAFRPAAERGPERSTSFDLPLAVMRVTGGNVLVDVAQILERAIPDSHICVVVSHPEQTESPMPIFEHARDPGAERLALDRKSVV